MQTVRWQREDARERSRADRNHQEQTNAESACGRGQDERADAEGGADLAEELLAGRGAAHSRDGDAVLRTTVSAGESKRALELEAL